MERDENEYLPVRMVNEYVYCPRLFWLEHVAGVFEPNEHTIEGVAVHKRVDRPGGKLAAPEALDGSDPEAPPWHARSLWLSCETLGVSGKLDLVDVDGDTGAVLPVDTKKGRATPDGGLWPSDDVQLTLQALLLRAAGFRVDSTAAWYKAERRRVTVPLSDERIARALGAVGEARTCAQQAEPPAPLVDSPKCPGCSLNAICLPDETNRLMAMERLAAEDVEDAGMSTDPIRRVVPARDDAIPLYLTGYGLRVGLKGSCIHVAGRSAEGEVDEEYGLPQLSQINVLGTAQITTQVLQECLRRDVPVCYFTGGGYFLGRTAGAENRWVAQRQAQFAAFGTPVATVAARTLVADKVANARTLLRRNHPDATSDAHWNARMKRLCSVIADVDDPSVLLAREGEAAKLYWEQFNELVGQGESGFVMAGRNRRPPRDPVNAMLGFVYALLVKDCHLAVSAAGLDPYLGVYHTPHHGRPSLALDLMEPFRPLVGDSVVLGLIRRQEVRPGDFVRTGQAVAMKPGARKSLIQAYERRMDELITHPVFGYRISYRQVLGVQARLLGRYFLGELTTLPPFRVR